MPKQRNGRNRKHVKPVWFPLAKYGEIVSAEEWHEEITKRALIQTQYSNSRIDWDESDSEASMLLSVRPGPLGVQQTLELFEADILQNNLASKGLVSTPKGSFWPVREPTPFEAIFIAKCFSGEKFVQERLWAKRLIADPAKYMPSFFFDGIQKAFADRNGWLFSTVPAATYNEVIGRFLPLVVDMNLDDESLESAFSVWLGAMRTNERKRQASDRSKGF